MRKETLGILRTRRGKTQKQVADALNISRATYANYELGRAEFPAKYLLAYCEFLKYSPAYVLKFGIQSEQEAIENLEISQSLANYANKNKANRNYLIWLTNEADAIFDGIVMMSVAYSCMPAEQRRHLSAMMWYAFNYCYNNYKLPAIADTLVQNSQQYKDYWNELDNKTK